MALLNGLPEFVSFGTPRKTVRILDEGDCYRVDRLTDNREFELPSQAYDYIRTELEADPVFDPADFTRHPSEIGPDTAFYAEPGTKRLLLVHTTADLAADLREDYSDWLAKNEAYAAAPDDFYTAYDWLDHHPAFWSGHAYKDGEIMWETNFGLGHDAPSVFKEPDGSVRVMLEAGPYTGEARAQHSLDTRLTSVAATYEAAIVLLASKVRKHYDETGAER